MRNASKKKVLMRALRKASKKKVMMRSKKSDSLRKYTIVSGSDAVSGFYPLSDLYVAAYGHPKHGCIVNTCKSKKIIWITNLTYITSLKTLKT